MAIYIVLDMNDCVNYMMYGNEDSEYMPVCKHTHIRVSISRFVLNTSMQSCLCQIYLCALTNKQNHCFQISLAICVKTQLANRPQTAAELLLINLSAR